MNIQTILRGSYRIPIQMSCRHRFHQKMNREISAFHLIENEKLRLHQRSMSIYQADSIQKTGFIKKIFRSIPFLGIDKTKLKVLSYLHYETIVDDINYVQFFDELDIPDTFYSWFVVMELHLWMLSVRAMAEGDEGRRVRNDIIEALWADVFQRVKKLGEATNPVETREKIVELSQQLQATFIAYDEGLQGEDIILASALWRRFYQQLDVDLEHLQLLVKYIRQNMRMLESLNKEQFYEPKQIKWSPLIS